MWSLGNASVKAFFGKKAYDLQVATLQAIVLLTFNPVDGASQTLTYAQVAERVNLPDEHLKRVLHSLACGKYKVLAKTPMSSRVALTDSFAVNTKFSCPMRKIRVPMASLDESHNPKRVEEDRSVAIEAAVVRIGFRNFVICQIFSEISATFREKLNSESKFRYLIVDKIK